MSERCVVFGDTQNLVGTVCEVSAAVPRDRQPSKVVAILPNAGVVHRIGPHRFNVKLARRLAGRGIASLRFDVAGQGDSRATPQRLTFEQQARADLRAAMDYMQQTHGAQRFVIAGICSGARQALAIAVDDPRVVGVWMFDGHYFRTFKTRWARSLRRYSGKSPRGVVMQLARSTSKVFKRLLPKSEGASQPVEFESTELTRQEFASALTALVNRGVHVFMAFSAGWLDHYSYADQFRDGFRQYAFVDKVRCDFLPHVDHILTPIKVQDEVIGAVSDWAVDISAGR